MTDVDAAAFESLLEHLKTARGFDFTGYKRASLMRRVVKRMESVRIARIDDYVDYLEVHPEEFTPLFNTILINVTGFFRDAAVWDMVRDDAIPQLIADRRRHDDIRVWSAGCASGEEPYTIAMLLAEHLGVDAFCRRVKIYATDVDEEALAQARTANYSERQLAGVPPEYLDRYFERNGNGYTFMKELRRCVIFGRHDLVQDAPISKVDLLSCRNTLMYFNAETQARIVQRFHFALRPNGYLVLGKAEMLLTNGALFAPVDLKRRLFMPNPMANGRVANLEVVAASPPPPVAVRADLRDSAIEALPAAAVILDASGLVVMANDTLRLTFGVDRSAIGREFHSLELSYRPLELRSRIEQVLTDGRPVRVSEVPHARADGTTLYFDIQVVPLMSGDGEVLGTAITFVDVSSSKRLQQELETANRELEDAYEELQSTNEELETTNEELQSTVEELETTNEELQSTNEELETMNEELHATNEELQAINDELTERTTELNRVNSFLESILTSFRGGVAVVANDQTVQIWNDGAEELWGVRSSEARGVDVLSLDVGLPLIELAEPLRLCLNGRGTQDSLVLDATNRRGRKIQCRVTISPLQSPVGAVDGAIILMEQVNQ